VKKDKMFNNKFIIAFEGIDGCGKTTQCKLFCDYLNKLGIRNRYVYEKFKENSIEKCMFGVIENSSPSSKLYYRFKEIIRTYEKYKVLFPDIFKKDGYAVLIFDRYKYSDKIFLRNQGIEKQIIDLLTNWLPDPDLLFKFDIDVGMSMSRIQSRGRQIVWYENVEGLSNMSRQFDYEIKMANSHVYRLDAGSNIASLQKEIRNIFTRLMSNLDISLFRRNMDDYSVSGSDNNV
jgi:dTMP kinase